VTGVDPTDGAAWDAVPALEPPWLGAVVEPPPPLLQAAARDATATSAAKRMLSFTLSSSTRESFRLLAASLGVSHT